MKNYKQYKNGNALVSIWEDGTRIIEFEEDLQLAYPLNIDIRVSSKCPFGQKEDGSPSLCSFCHESAKVNGVECDYRKLKSAAVEDICKSVRRANSLFSFFHIFINPLTSFSFTLKISSNIL